ncbi:hypothetical protein BDR26DRAFT_808382, partial [Obelidium mucronatum]
ASTSIPGNIPVDQTPQFITLTLDDGVQPRTIEAFMPIQVNATNPNGCTAPVTFFASNDYSDYFSITQMYANGSEIAVHTMDHISYVRHATAQISSSYHATRVLSGIPREQLIGFRHPFLSFSPATFQSIYNLKSFVYESSVAVNPITNPYWPHTLDKGIPYASTNCAHCQQNQGFVFPGLWEIPMYALMTSAPTPQVWTSMDPLNDNDFLENLKTSFKIHYAKKLPFGLYQHAGNYLPTWPSTAAPKRFAILMNFILWVKQNYKDVWYVTNIQLLQWISNPVPASKMGEFMGAGNSCGAKSMASLCPSVKSCNVGGKSFKSCNGCPTAPPSSSDPLPGMTS